MRRGLRRKRGVGLGKAMRLFGVMMRLKSSGRSWCAVSEMTRMVALGIFLRRQTWRMVSDSISTASIPVTCQSLYFSLAVQETRLAHSKRASFALEASRAFSQGEP